MSTAQLVPCIDSIMGATTPRTELEIAFLERAILSMQSVHAEAHLVPKAGGLLQLITQFPDRAELTELVATIMKQALPLGYDGTVPTGPLTPTLENAGSRWRKRLSVSVSADALHGLLQRPETAKAAASTAIALLYSTSHARRDLAPLIATLASSPDETNVPIIQAFLDAAPVREMEGELRPTLDAVAAQVGYFAKEALSISNSLDQRRLSGECVFSLVKQLSERQEEFKNVLSSALQSAPYSAILDWEVLRLLNGLADEIPKWRGTDGLIATAVESGLKWIVRRFAEDPADSRELLHSLDAFGE